MITKSKTEKVHPDQMECLVMVFKEGTPAIQMQMHVDYITQWPEMYSCQPVKPDSKMEWVRRMFLIRCTKQQVGGVPVATYLIDRMKQYPFVADCYVHERVLTNPAAGSPKAKAKRKAS